MKIDFNSDDDLPPKQTIELRNMIIAVESFFHESITHYPHIFR